MNTFIVYHISDVAIETIPTDPYIKSYIFKKVANYSQNKIEFIYKKSSILRTFAIDVFLTQKSAICLNTKLNKYFINN